MEDLSPTTVQHTLICNDLDLLGYLSIQAGGKERVEYWKVFHDVLQSSPFQGNGYGRIHNIFSVVQLATCLTIGIELMERGNDQKEFNAKDIPGGFPMYSISEWSHVDWDGFYKFLLEIKQSLLRQDANVMVTEKSEPNPTQAQGREKHKQFNLRNIHRLIEVHKVMAPLRSSLDKVLNDESVSDETVPKINNKRLTEFVKEASKQEDERVKVALLTLLEDSEGEETAALKSIKLRPVGVLRTLLNEMPFSLIMFYDRIQAHLDAWMKEVFGQPVLLRLFQGGRDDDDAAAVQHLHTARTTLRASVMDPLQESLTLVSTLGNHKGRNTTPKRRERPTQEEKVDDDEVENQSSVSSRTRRQSKTRRISRGKFLERKPTAKRLTFEDSDNDDDVEGMNYRDGALLSELPRNRPNTVTAEGTHHINSVGKRLLSQDKKYEGRRLWTDEEKTAIKEGIKLLGIGRWADIKDEYQIVLENRTSGQIKDCFRTMKKRGELDELEKEGFLQVKEKLEA